MNFNQLDINGLVAKIPIVQGGMGVGVSLSNLAGAVAAEGGVGVLSAAQIGFNAEGFAANPLKANLSALARHLDLARKKAKGGVIGVNIMCVTKNYEEYVQCCADHSADLIVSGAGLPINLPDLVKNTKLKIAPIISSLKAAKVLLKLWDKRYNATADMIVIEGPKAGGHLGFTVEEAQEARCFDSEIKEIIDCIKTYGEKFGRKIPVIFGGGIFDQNDVAHALELGCDGAQVASRFVVTGECDVHENFKQAYIDAKAEDIGIIKSPVGMPGRAIINGFLKKIMNERQAVEKCYACIAHCDPKTTPYCITQALINSAKGDVENGLVFCGAETHRINQMTSVKELMKELTE